MREIVKTEIFKMRLLSLFFGACALCMAMSVSYADSLIWRGPTQTMTIGVTENDITHVEFPEPIKNISLENQDYVDILVVEGYNNRAFRMQSLLPKMATRMFLTGASGNTYVVVVTTDVPYRSFLTIADGTKIDDIERKIAKGYDENDLIRAMSLDEDMPGVIRETYVIPNWFAGAGLQFDLSEVWQSSTQTGLVVHVRNMEGSANEVNIPAISIPQTDEWGQLRYASMENMRLAPRGQPNDQGLLYLVFIR